MELQDAILTVPGPRKGELSRAIDLRDILVAENRQNEVATVTPMKAPELLSLFNGAWRDVDLLVKQLTAAKIKAEKQIVRRGAELLLGEVDSILKAKGLSSTKDTRDAVIALDADYQDAQERFDQITAACEYLKGKLKSFENAFSSVKKIMGEDTYNMSGRVGNPNLKGDASTPRPASTPRVNPAAVRTPMQDNLQPAAPQNQPVPASVPKSNGFGKARYDR